MAHNQFFYRIDGLDLTPGNKTAGFCFSVSTQAMAVLAKEPVLQEEIDRLMTHARKRLSRFGSDPAKSAANAEILFFENTACPRAFISDAIFGGSIGADPETFGKLLTPHPLDRIGPEVEFTPHNCDLAEQALILVVLAQTWAEYAWAKLSEFAGRGGSAMESSYLVHWEGKPRQLTPYWDVAEHSGAPVVESFDSEGKRVKVYRLVNGRYEAHQD
ncbi:hypothetical protein A9R05_42925 (plasmid) [Burkholderia sp. KK1]|uniref:hypothetical protein n=1 Tax=Burkholderia sp. M701 TaxID=326454 RepID=UPI000979954F|nr:hypothetical protein [Burkholderia sp. M701]AQH05774.1 hypothetical protein A9R05_42925 [Burkholderia sp. KK1]